MIGFAGTSAGAIVAALAAVGYRSDELFGEQGSLLDELVLDQPPGNKQPIGKPTRLIGPGWLGIRMIRFLSLIWFWLAVSILWVIAISAELAILLEAPALVAMLPIALILLLMFLLVAYGVSGLARLNSFKDGLALALAKKISDTNGDKPVTFRTLHERGLPSLKIIASDISNRRMQVFSYQYTPDVAVADAVSASICLPIIFRPWEVDGNLHMDGGLVSNLPAWAFDEERRLDREAATAAIQIAEPGAPGGQQNNGLGALASATRTVLAGADQLSKRNVDRLFVVQLDVAIGLLDFDLTRQKALDIVGGARKQAQDRLINRMLTLEKNVTKICKIITEEAKAVIDEALSLRKRPSFIGKIRTSIFVPEGINQSGRPLSLRNAYNFNLDNAADQRISLPIDDSFVGSAWLTGVAKLGSRSNSGQWGGSLARPEHLWLRSLIWPEMKWCLCVPFEDDSLRHPIVVSLDSDCDIDLPENSRRVVFEVLIEIIETILNDLSSDGFGAIFDDR